MSRLFLILCFGAACAAQPLPLSMKQAVDLALAPAGNARWRLAQEAAAQARARQGQARAALLPNIDASIAAQDFTRNLRAFGVRFDLPVPGFALKEVVGPFAFTDLRAAASQTVFDFSALRRYQASKAARSAAEAGRESARNQVTELVARAYLAALRAEAAVETARANVKLAEALARLAQSQKAAGTGTGIEITRAEVQLANERQRLLIAANDEERTRLQLVKAIGLKLDAEISLTDSLDYRVVEDVAAGEAVRLGQAQRMDLEAQRRREQSARLNYSSVKLERIPSVIAMADAGGIGLAGESLRATRTYGATLRIPLWDGGRRDERRAEALAELRAEQVRSEDMTKQVELEIRLAIDFERSAAEQTKVSEEGLRLAENELAQAQRRYEAGVATGLEVTDAQTRLARARENRIAALFNHNLARVELASAMGAVHKIIQ